MSNQAAITAKSTLTVTGTTAYSYAARGVTLTGGKPSIQIANYRYQLAADNPAADTILRISSGERAVQGKYGPGWKADLRLEAPTMEVLAAGDASGYVAAPKAADFSGLWLSGTFSDRMTATDKNILWDQLVYILANDATVKAAFLSRDTIS